jgi:hypothetical protein
MVALDRDRVEKSAAPRPPVGTVGATAALFPEPAIGVGESAAVLVTRDAVVAGERRGDGAVLDVRKLVVAVEVVALGVVGGPRLPRLRGN